MRTGSGATESSGRYMAEIGVAVGWRGGGVSDRIERAGGGMVWAYAWIVA